MKKTIKYLVPMLAAAAASATFGLAPVASGAQGMSQNAAPAPAPSPSHAPPQFDTGTSPLVPANTGANPFVLVPPGYGLPS